MNKSNSHFLDRKYDVDNWKSWVPEKFLSILAHELRDPLALIKGYIAILSNENTQEIHPMALEAISNSVHRIEELQEGILEYMNEHLPKS